MFVWDCESCSCVLSVPGGMAAAEVIKGDSTVYGSPGANLVAMGDQGLQEEGGTMGAASGWGQFPNGWFYPLNNIDFNTFVLSSVAMMSHFNVHSWLFTCTHAWLMRVNTAVEYLQLYILCCTKYAMMIAMGSDQVSIGM